jgi:chromosomal replication initiation ATPase DnaA
MTPRQLTLPLDHTAKFTAEDFLVAPANEAVHRIVTAWPNWPSRGLFVVGPPGSGKSHLVAIWAERAEAAIHGAENLSEELVAELPENTAIAVENIDFPECSESTLFHLMNTAREKGLWLVLTASQAPSLVWPGLPDLASRLRQLPLAELQPPDDGLVRAVLVKLFDDRQLAVDAEVIDYIARRMERSLGAAREVVAALDEEALALGRRVTKPVAAAVLARLTSEVD